LLGACERGVVAGDVRRGRRSGLARRHQRLPPLAQADIDVAPAGLRTLAALVRTDLPQAIGREQFAAGFLSQAFVLRAFRGRFVLLALFLFVLRADLRGRLRVASCHGVSPDSIHRSRGAMRPSFAGLLAAPSKWRGRGAERRHFNRLRLAAGASMRWTRRLSALRCGDFRSRVRVSWDEATCQSQSSELLAEGS
jgi:hypothetical protein